ncbi:class I SAM-dependent methyltransferase [Candidatus Woesearchaeota archaeon]|jgi:ubiquinone/menaquinone biosynthesis C-methylase UbiE|nr:class I SAM-dependent methyltransferase [Candidatus Woesearchaeota archaeon]
MTLSQNQIKKKYNRFSLFYDLVEWPIEKLLFSKWRKKLLKNSKGKVLEIGVGTGKNLSYYNYHKIDLTVIDISKGMLNRAKEKAKKHDFPVKFKLANSEKLPFEDNSFDYIVCTFVLCSVSDQVKILKEMKRVLKKKGKILFLEHMLSRNKFIAFLEHLHNPITKFLFGFNINRKTIENIKKSGLKIVKDKNIAVKDVFKELEVTK